MNPGQDKCAVKSVRWNMIQRKRTVLATVLVLSFGIFFSTSCPASTAPDPTEQLRPFIDKIVAILNNPNLHGDEKCAERRAKVRQAAKERFDFFEMSKRVLGSQWRKLSQEEKEGFVDLFTTLLEHAYIGKIEDYAKQRVVFKDQRIKKNRAQVNTVLIGQEVVIPVTYIMILKDPGWMVYDVIIEGVSLIRNYMEQFKDILRKDGYASLLQQLRVKVKELEATIAPCPITTPTDKS
jgi:phospholipid transport system substrate-binding protein